MPELSKLAQKTNDLTSAYDERKRTFDKLRDLNLTDEQRTAAIDDYIAAAKHFDDLRAKFSAK